MGLFGTILIYFVFCFLPVLLSSLGWSGRTGPEGYAYAQYSARPHCKQTLLNFSNLKRLKKKLEQIEFQNLTNFVVWPQCDKLGGTCSTLAVALMLCYGLSLTSQLSSIRDRSSVTRLSLNKRQQQQKSIFRAALISPTFLPRECHLPLSSFPLLLRRLKENTEQNLVL